MSQSAGWIRHPNNKREERKIMHVMTVGCKCKHCIPNESKATQTGSHHTRTQQWIVVKRKREDFYHDILPKYSQQVFNVFFSFIHADFVLFVSDEWVKQLKFMLAKLFQCWPMNWLGNISCDDTLTAVEIYAANSNRNYSKLRREKKVNAEKSTRRMVINSFFFYEWCR